MTVTEWSDDLISDLNSRANPERSRRFSSEQFEIGLQRLESLTACLLSNPLFHHRPALRISIVGTNGKGTVAFALESLFRQALSQSLKDADSITGLYTSPHLIDFTERIRINGIPVRLDELEGLHQTVRHQLRRIEDRESSIFFEEIFNSLSYFELLTLLGFLLFQMKHTAVQILEAGLGGRLDATRIAQSDAVVLTSIGLDHTALLGRTRKRIFKEKMGILSGRTRFLFLPDARYRHWLTEALPADSLPSKNRLQIFVNSHPAHSDYLVSNANYARFIYNTLRLPLDLPEADDEKVKIQPPPGRKEVRQASGKTWIFDNAHNASAILTLLQGLKESISFSGTAVVLAVPADRRPAPVLRLIGRYRFARLILITGNGFHDVAGITGITMDDLRRWTGVDQILRLPLESARLADQIPESTVLFMGSHRLYDLFDRETRRNSGEP
jgi:dihydrofolate synthase/folylpolyglutamate synthase